MEARYFRTHDVRACTFLNPHRCSHIASLEEILSKGMGILSTVQERLILIIII